MAVIKYKTGKRQLVPEFKGRQVWLVLNRLQPANPTQAEFVRAVEDVMLFWQTAPDEYIKQNFEDIAPRMVAQWRVDRQGRPLRPEYGDQLHLAEKWGLWSRGKPSILAVEAIESMSRPKRYRQQSLIHSN